jgi:hypothetical protein
LDFGDGALPITGTLNRDSIAAGEFAPFPTWIAVEERSVGCFNDIMAPVGAYNEAGLGNCLRVSIGQSE